MTPLPAAVLFPAWFITVILAGAAGAWIAWPMAFDRGFEEALEPERQRHRHRIGDPQETTLLALPRAERLALEPLPEPEHAPVPEWMFFGAQVQPQPGRDEYDLMTRHAGTSPPGDAAPEETPSAWTRRQGEQLARDIDEMIAASEQRRRELVEESNYFQHAILAEGPRHGKREEGAR